MKNKGIVIVIIILAFALLIAGASLLYNFLKDQIDIDPFTGQAQTGSSASAEGSKNQNNSAKDNPAPNFTVVDANGNEVKLSDFQGKPVVLNFWASWCGPCRSEMPEFEEFYRQYGDEIQFMMVNLTDGSAETIESASEYIAEQGYTFPLFFDTKSDAAIAYGVSTIPVSYFIDTDGNLIAWARAAISASTLQKGIDMILKQE